MSSRPPSQQPTFITMTADLGNRTAAVSNTAQPVQQAPAQPISPSSQAAIRQQAQHGEIPTTPTSTSRLIEAEDDDIGVAVNNVPTDRNEESQDEKPQDEEKRSPSSPELDRKGTVEIRHNGRLVLHVGTDGAKSGRRTLIVSLDIIKNLSPQWDAVVAGSAHKCLSRKRHVRLPEDDADMMQVLMYIVHTLFVEVPENLRFSQLLEMAQICRRYGVSGKVLPYISNWANPHRPKILMQGYEHWLYIAWVFGFTEDHDQLTRHFLLNCRVNKEGVLMKPGTREEFSGYIPQDHLNSIRRTRVKTLGSFFDTTYNYVFSMEGGNICQASDGLPGQPPLASDERTSCTFLNHGSMIRYLKMWAFWPPVTNVDKVRNSINEVADILTRIPVVALNAGRHDSVTTNGKVTADNASASRHAVCDAGRVLAVEIEKMLQGIQS